MIKINIKLAPGQDWDTVRRRLRALPPILEAECYGFGMLNAARGVARVSRQLCNVGPPDPRTNAGKPRRHLRDSIRAIPIAWRWGGRKVPRSAAIVLAEQPHAHFLERGSFNVRTGRRNRAYPFLEPPMRDSARLLKLFKSGAGAQLPRALRKLARRRRPRRY